MKTFLLRWLIGVAYLIEGIIKILTFGYVNARLPLLTAKWYSRSKNTTTNNR